MAQLGETVLCLPVRLHGLQQTAGPCSLYQGYRQDPGPGPFSRGHRMGRSHPGARAGPGHGRTGSPCPEGFLWDLGNPDGHLHAVPIADGQPGEGETVPLRRGDRFPGMDRAPDVQCRNIDPGDMVHPEIT